MALKINKKQSIIASLCITVSAVVTGAVLSFLHDRDSAVSAIQSTYTVTSTSDSGAGSLRQAILDANLEPTTPSAPHLIQFNINGGGVHTIQLLSDLPTITNPTIIDGSTQPGASCGSLVPSIPASSNTPHTLLIELRGVALGGGTKSALDFAASADGSVLRGLVVNSSVNTNATEVNWSAPNGLVECNYIATAPDGVSMPAVANGNNGIAVWSTGGNTRLTNNLISGSRNNQLYTDNAPDIEIDHNLVGANQSGTARLSGAPTDANGISISGNGLINAHIHGNLVAGFTSPDGWTGYGIFVLNAVSSGIVIAGNLVGTNLAGLAAIPNDDGVAIHNSAGITVGGSSAVDRNILSGNAGSGLSVYKSNQVSVKGNYAGLAADGMTALGNANVGLGYTLSTNIQIGGQTPGEANVAVANGGSGISAGGESSSVIEGNYIGVLPDGTPMGNTSHGIGGNGSTVGSGMRIGGTAPGSRNVISSNGGNAMWLVLGTNDVTIEGNYIGLAPDGRTLRSNGGGIDFSFGGMSNIRVGGSSPEQRNYIVGSGDGIALRHMDASSGNVIEGNYVGFDIDGNVPAGVSGARFGIVIEGGVGRAEGVRIGGSNPGQGNIVGGYSYGIHLSQQHHPSGSDMVVQGNTIGLKPDGTTAAGNSVGIQMVGFNNVTGSLLIGGTSPGEGNIIAGNQEGISAHTSDATAHPFRIYGNKIGIDKNGNAKGNTQRGVYIHSDSKGFLVGGTAAGQANTIAYNRKGVVLEHSNTTSVSARANSIYGNTVMAIDLGNNGETQNDTQDADIGPNGLQNYPEVRYITRCDNSTGGPAPLLHSTPNTSFTIDYYANPSWVAGQPLQAEQWLSSQIVTTNASGNASITYPTGSNVTMTATAPDGSTSEVGGRLDMSFADCQPMSQRALVDTTQSFNLGASWTESNADGYYRNYAIWNGSSWVDNITQSGLIMSITVGGQPVLWNEPLAQWSNAYYLSSSDWSANGHLATALPEGVYDAVITVTDPISGLSMTHTYTDAIKVTLPKLTYTTTITNNQTPTLSGTVADVENLYEAYIVPAGQTLDTNTTKPRVFVWRPDTVDYTKGSWQIISSKADYIAHLQQKAADDKAAWPRTLANNWFSDVPEARDVVTIDDLKNLCVQTVVQDRLLDWMGIPATESDCRAYLQQRYDDNIQYIDNDLQANINDANSSDPFYDFTPLPEGAYDIYIYGTNFDYQPFSKNFAAGLVIDLTNPNATLTTDSGSVSPALRGVVDDPTAKVEVTINGHTYTAQNNGDGTWVLGAGIIAPLAPGDYQVVITVTDLAGNNTTTTKTIRILGATTAHSALSPTGWSIFVVIALAGGAMTAGASVLIQIQRRRNQSRVSFR